MAWTTSRRPCPAANVITAVGRLEEYDKLYLVMVEHAAGGPRRRSARTVLRAGRERLVRLQDVARSTTSTEPQWIRVTADGHDAVLFQVFQQPDGNTVADPRGHPGEARVAGEDHPADVKIANWYDQSALIVASATSVRDAVLIGIVLAALVLLVFLRNLKVTLIAGRRCRWCWRRRSCCSTS